MIQVLIQLVTAACLQDHPNMELKKCQNFYLDMIQEQVVLAKDKING